MLTQVTVESVLPERLPILARLDDAEQRLQRTLITVKSMIQLRRWWQFWPA